MSFNLVKRGEVFYADSREIADMTNVRHGHLLEKIEGYAEILKNSTEPRIRLSDFFVECTYRDSTGRTLKRFDCTRKGCDMIANKMPGEKGVLFTATYVIKFEEMEKAGQSVVPDVISFRLAAEAKAKNAEARLLNAKTKRYEAIMKTLDKHPTLSPESKQQMISYALSEVTGQLVLPAPQVRNMFSITEIAVDLGVHRNSLGRIATKYDLRTEQYGMWVLGKSEHSEKQVKQFMYYDEGKDALIEAYRKEKGISA